jgi:RecB family exonuclease
VDANAGILPAASISPASELVELALAVQHARRVVMCHRVVDDDGAALAPTPLVSWLERGGVPSATVHGAPLLGPPTTPHERTLALLAIAPDRASHIAPYAARVAMREREREDLHASTTRTSTLGGAAALLPLLEVETGGGVSPLAVTAVERMARCKFQGFAAQVLKAVDDDPRLRDDPDRREEGILTHEALGAAFTAAEPYFRVRPRDRDAIERAARTASDAVLARSGSAAVQAGLDRIRVEVANIVSLAIDDDAWNFALAEQGFGNREDEWPAFVIEDAETHVALRGRIDRIDVHAAANASRVRAIDYKRRVSMPPTVELGQAALQVPIYALVAQRALGTVEAQGRYLSTVRPARTSTPLFDARMAELLMPRPDGTTEETRVVLETIRAVRAGDVTPRPIAPKWCAQCGLDGACRRPRFAVTLGREEDE